jgi:dolichol-phosphate mannosyltransferase
MTKKQITIVIPCFNEEKNIEILIKRLSASIEKIKNYNFEYIFVDDGSTDETYNKLKELSKVDNRIKLIKLSRNFGNHNAISAGIENVKDSNCLIVFSSDLQEPPEKISEMILKWEEENDVVWAIREKRSQSFFGKFLSNIFYKLFISASGFKNYPKEGPSCFFLLDKKVYVNWHKFKESNRMVLGIVAWMGFTHTKIKYVQSSRKKGISSFNLFKLIKLAIDSFVSFSHLPIRLISYFGIIISLFGFSYAAYLTFLYLTADQSITGWTSLMVIILILGGFQLITLGIIGEYIWRGVDESRSRPLYLISEKINFNEKED